MALGRPYSAARSATHPKPSMRYSEQSLTRRRRTRLHKTVVEHLQSKYSRRPRRNTLKEERRPGAAFSGILPRRKTCGLMCAERPHCSHRTCNVSCRTLMSSIQHSWTTPPLWPDRATRHRCVSGGEPLRIIQCGQNRQARASSGALQHGDGEYRGRLRLLGPPSRPMALLALSALSPVSVAVYIRDLPRDSDVVVYAARCGRVHARKSPAPCALGAEAGELDARSGYGGMELDSTHTLVYGLSPRNKRDTPRPTPGATHGR
jgi:hypothetical protein